MSDENDKLLLIKNQLTNIGWNIKESEKYLYLIPKYSKSSLLKLNTAKLEYKLSANEIYAYSVILAIEEDNYQYNELTIQRMKFRQSLNDDLLDHSFGINLEECVENAISHATKMYYPDNWQTLKPILEKLLDSTRKNSTIYKQIYNALCEKFETIKP